MQPSSQAGIWHKRSNWSTQKIIVGA